MKISKKNDHLKVLINIIDWKQYVWWNKGLSYYNNYIFYTPKFSIIAKNYFILR